MTNEAKATGASKPGRVKQPKKFTTVEVEAVIVGRDKKVIPRNEVRALAAMGCKDKDIANWFGIDDNTLRYNFATELTLGLESLKQSLRQKQIEVALSGNPTLLIWLGKQILQQTDQPLFGDGSKVLPWNDD